MISNGKKLLVVQVAALGYEFLRAHDATGMNGLTFRPMETVFPAVTCPVQASFRTAELPGRHGMVANGMYCRDLRKALFWEQSSALVKGPRIWKSFREKGGKVAMLFWQQSLGEDVDFLLSPAPVHKHHGGMIQDCYSKPASLYEKMCRAVGKEFNLMHYWGPAASGKSSDWIASATVALMKDPELAPDLCLTYLPVLDYDLQRFGPSSAEASWALHQLQAELDLLLKAAAGQNYDMIVFGDYAMGAVDKGAVFPNRLLQEAGLFSTRTVRGMLYPDLHESRAFTVVDHEVAHVYVKSDENVKMAAACLGGKDGVGKILDREQQKAAGIDNPASGDLVLVAAPGCWFAYPWWENAKEAPDYAGHVDIHNKPGYDPCELFWAGWPLFAVSQDCSKVKGSHGRAGADRPVAWASTCSLAGEPSTLVELAGCIRKKLE